MFQQAQFVYTTPPNQSDASESDDGNYDHSSDKDYTLAAATSDNAQTTPSSRVEKKTATTDAAKSRVNIATQHLTGSRCLLENTNERNAVEYAHCLRRTTSSEIVRNARIDLVKRLRSIMLQLYNLEYSWGMKARTLNLDTRYNIMRLSSKFHKLLDDGLWILLPQQKIIAKYLQALPNVESGARPKRLTKIASPKGPYIYTVFAHPNMRSVPLFRQKDESTITETHQNLDETLTKDDFEFMPHPFTGMTLKSHVHPRYVICNVGLLMHETGTVPRFIPLYAGYNAALGQTLNDILAIFNSWRTLYDKHIDLKIVKALEFRKNERAEKFRDDSVSHTAPLRVDDSDLPSRRSKRNRTSSEAH